MVLALGTAVVLAAALVWTSFTASSEAVSPSALRSGGAAGRSYELTGTVLPGYRRDGRTLLFRVRDRSAGGGAGASVAVRYRGQVPDPFRAGREVIVTVRRRGSSWVGDRDSLVTKCPSKFRSA